MTRISLSKFLTLTSFFFLPSVHDSEALIGRIPMTGALLPCKMEAFEQNTAPARLTSNSVADNAPTRWTCVSEWLQSMSAVVAIKFYIYSIANKMFQVSSSRNHEICNILAGSFTQSL
ncbi:hypothetical protein MRB53_038569 [Persea americana]|nr:hypothetical protein MRB53_038569 [Persea americana]